MLFIEILRNIDMYKEEKYATYHLILKNLPLLISFFQEFLYSSVLFTFSKEVYIKNYINSCYTKNSIKYGGLYKLLLLKELTLPYYLLEI